MNCDKILNILHSDKRLEDMPILVVIVILEILEENGHLTEEKECN